MKPRQEDGPIAVIVFAVIVVAILTFHWWNVSRDQVRAFCHSVPIGSIPTGDPTGAVVHGYTLHGQAVTDWTWPDGVVITWHDGVVVWKNCAD